MIDLEKCPICNHNLIRSGNFYTCDYNIFPIKKTSPYRKIGRTFNTIELTNISHYELLLHNYEAYISVTYILPPFYIKTNNDCDKTIIYIIKENRSFAFDTSYSAKFLCKIDYFMPINKDNLEDIKNKLNCYLTFS
jgi:hypothetical protein